MKNLTFSSPKFFFFLTNPGYKKQAQTVRQSPIVFIVNFGSWELSEVLTRFTRL
jgi:hypothetical protein